LYVIWFIIVIVSMALEQARKEANLRLLQRSSDPTISNILGSATHVVLYQFQQSTQTWEKSNVEGSLFLAVRPLGYLLIIVNRNSPDNFILSLERDFQLQHKDPYLIFKQQQQQGQQGQGQTTIIRGIWFPNPQERVEMNDLLTQVLQTLRMAPVAVTAPPPDSYLAPMTTSAFASTSSLSGGGGGGGGGAHIDPGAAMAALLSPLSLGAETSQSMGSYLATTTPTTAAATSPLSTIGTLQNSENNNISGGGGYSHQRNMSPSGGGGQSPMLDKKSLQLALLSLIQDERFLDLLHAQYLKVAHARTNRSGRPPSSGSSSTS
jgi:mRNA-decapping enzyme 1B